MKSRPGIENHPLTQAARLSDDLSEIDIESSIRQAGLEPEDLAYVAEQRALRYVLICVRKMSPDQFRELNKLGRYQAFKLSEYELYLLRMFISCEMDGLMVGWRGHQIAGEQT